jgi:hypothetical protein
MLARNGDVQGAVNAVRRLEDRWNRRRNYPWVFLNDDDFSDEFKTCVRAPLPPRVPALTGAGAGACR